MTAPASYEEARRIAARGSAAERAALAARPDAPPEILYYLAGAAEPAVRAAVAANPAAPVRADRMLAGDADPALRATLGRKLAPRAPELALATDKLRSIAWRTLCQLAADTAVMVRAVIAEELQAMPDAPRALILQLAQDAAMEVAEPVLRFSPLLTEEDLLALLRAPPAPETVTAIARRPHLTEPLADAVAARAEEAPVAALLANGSAAIRERTLDALIIGAAAHLPWQERLVARPGLSPAALQMLAGLVADHLLEPLSRRPDLDPPLAQELRARVAARLDLAARLPSAEAFEQAARLGARDTMLQLLAAAAGLPEPAVRRAARLRSAKALVALCWKAGFPPATALPAQTVLGEIAPVSVLRAEAAGEWPLSEAEMRWQLTLLTEPEAV